MQNKNTFWFIAGSIAIILILLSIFGVFSKLSILGNVGEFNLKYYLEDEYMPKSTGTFILSGFEGEYESTFIGTSSFFFNKDNPVGYSTLSSRDGKSDSYQTPELILSNSFIDGNKLTIQSSIDMLENSDGSNINKFKIVLPSGKVSVECKGELTEQSQIVCGIVNHGLIKMFSDDEQYLELILDKPTELIFYLETASQGGVEGIYVDGELIVKFDKEIEKDYYQLKDGACSKVELFESEKTSYDFETLEECELRIEKVGFFQKIWAFIVNLFTNKQ